MVEQAWQGSETVANISRLCSVSLKEPWLFSDSAASSKRNKESGGNGPPTSLTTEPAALFHTLFTQPAPK